MHFELVDTETVEEKRTAFETEILKKINYFSERFYSVGYLLQDTRFLSGEITNHVKITKDKFREISLNMKMLIHLLRINNERIQSSTYFKAYTLCIYIVARTFKILLLIKAIDEDYFLDFKEDLSTLGKLIYDNSFLTRTAIDNELDVNWLISGEFPDNIATIRKDIRANGFLK